MIRRPPRSTRTDTLFPYTTLFRSHTCFKCPPSLSTRCLITVSVLARSLRLTLPRLVCTRLTERGPNAAIRTLQPSATCPAETSRSEEHTSELQSLMRISYAVFCLKKKKKNKKTRYKHTQ